MADRITHLKTRLKRFALSKKKGRMVRSALAWQSIRWKQHFAHQHARKLVLIIGPESTGTRIFTEILSGHPDIMGTPDASTHVDVLDAVWEHLERGQLAEAVAAFPDPGPCRYILTRRSVPHAVGDRWAHFMEFPHLDRLAQWCQELDIAPLVLLTSRSPAANLASSALQRASANKSLEKATVQYWAAYRHLFAFLLQTDAPFYVLSLEALVLDQDAYVQSLFQLLGLEPYPLELDLHPDPNGRRYAWYAEQFVAGRTPR